MQGSFDKMQGSFDKMQGSFDRIHGFCDEIYHVYTTRTEWNPKVHMNVEILMGAAYRWDVLVHFTVCGRGLYHVYKKTAECILEVLMRVNILMELLDTDGTGSFIDQFVEEVYITSIIKKELNEIWKCISMFMY